MNPWQQHISRVGGLLSANPVRRYVPPPVPDVAAEVEPNLALPSFAAQFGGVDTMPAPGMAPGPNAGGGGASAPSDRNTQFSGLGVGPGERLPSTGMAGAGVPGAFGRAGFSAATAMLGPAGMALSGINTANNAYNAVQNYNDLGAWGVNVGAGDVLGGIGGGRFGGTLADAMDASGFGSLRGAEETGGFPEINNDGPQMMAGDIMGGGGGFFQRGGYTGAGADGVVQPDRPAGTVHEGEGVISAAAMRAGGDGLLRMVHRLNRQAARGRG